MRFQFRLRTLFIVVTVAVVACAWLGHEHRVVKERIAMKRWIDERDGVCTYWEGHTEGQPSFVRRWLGDEPITFIAIPSGATDADRERIQRVFPDATISPWH